MSNRPTKAKRKLSNINFENEGAHIALVSKEQSPANGHDYALVLKSKNYTPEFLEKMQQVRVTMELPEFLSVFWNMYEADAEALAKFFGYKEPEDDSKEMPEDYEDAYETYMMSKLESFEIIKSLYEADNMLDLMSSLEESEILSLLQDWERLEKAFTVIEKSKSKQVAEKTTVDKPNEAKTSVTKPNIVKGKQMQTEVQVPIETESDLLLKSQYESQLVSLQKSLDEQIQKNKEREESFEAFKREHVLKAKLAQISSIIKDSKQAEVIAKAGYSLTDDEFAGYVDVIKALASIAEQSDLFVEKGLNLQGEEPTQKSKLAEKIKANLEKNK